MQANIRAMTIRIKPATSADAPIILQLIRELAEFERLLHEVQATEEQLREQLFGPRPGAEVVIARMADEVAGFALFLPQFTSPALGSPPLQLATLGLLLTFIAFGFNVLASFVFASLRALRVNSPRWQRHGNGLVGALFMLLASRLAFGKAG